MVHELSSLHVPYYERKYRDPFRRVTSQYGKGWILLPNGKGSFTQIVISCFNESLTNGLEANYVQRNDMVIIVLFYLKTPAFSEYHYSDVNILTLLQMCFLSNVLYLERITPLTVFRPIIYVYIFKLLEII